MSINYSYLQGEDVAVHERAEDEAGAIQPAGGKDIKAGVHDGNCESFEDD